MDGDRHNLKVPESLKEEHEAFIDCLKGQSTGKDQTGAAVRQLLKLLEPHVEKEDEFVLPLLGSLRSLAAGKPLENPKEVMLSYEKYSGQYGSMFDEHLPIRQAIKKARAAAKKEGYQGILETLDALAHHSRVEEEVLYPTALLVGKVARRPPAATAPDRVQSDDGLSYFALDYDAPISSVVKNLGIRHHELDEMLSEVEELADKGKLRVAVSLLNAIGPLILRSAVEEEARVMRVVMEKNRSRTQQSVAVAQQHREIADFLKHQLPELSSKPPDKARRSIMRFVRLVQNHLRREERVPFSLAASE